MKADHSIAILDPVQYQASPPDDWSPIGFDVADHGMTSGLVNCGYDEKEKPACQRRWSGLLDDHGLFTTLDDAAAFAHACDRQVPEHAPFFVYGLYRGPYTI